MDGVAAGVAALVKLSCSILAVQLCHAICRPAGTLNALLARQPQAQRRGLSLRTYAVLPLTDDCGILQV
jgi:hypothetical protein